MHLNRLTSKTEINNLKPSTKTVQLFDKRPIYKSTLIRLCSKLELLIECHLCKFINLQSTNSDLKIIKFIRTETNYLNDQKLITSVKKICSEFLVPLFQFKPKCILIIHY